MRHRITAGAFKELRKRPGVMLSYFVLRRTLRHTAQFQSELPGLIVVIVDKGWVDRFHRAAELLLSGQRQAFFNAETSRHRVVTIDSQTKRKVDLDVLRYSAQTIVVTDSFDILPAKARLAADEILYVDNPTPRHVQAVRKLTGRSKVDAEAARRVANGNWEEIDALLCRQSLDKLNYQIATGDKDSTSAGPKLSELPGFPSVRLWASELGADLGAWRARKLEWSNIDRAAVLVGPPGVGKTMCAGALAAELGLAFVSTSAGQWQSAGGGYLGDMLKSMRSSFEQAAASKSGALLFIDELDSIGNRAHQSNHAYYETQVVNTFLELTSRDTPGVMMLAATNRIDDIEAAILRSGRFERRIFIDLPTADERAQILSYHLGNFGPERIRRWTDQLHGFSPADLERVGRAIKRSARAAGRDVTLADVKVGMPARINLSDDALHRVAVHECGHAVVALSCDFVTAVTIELSDTIFEDRGVQPGGQVHYDTRDLVMHTEDILRAQIRISLAGLAAEEMELGSKSTGAGGYYGSDLETATTTARLMVATWGMGRVPRFHADRRQVERNFKLSDETSDEIGGILLEEWKNVKDLLQRKRGALVQLASDLLVQRTVRLEAGGEQR
ncbi:AAA family ATPase [Rhizobium leguminosarum]|uniref:AAA family ATPase n=1 Tax=Rhizobium leguminosarum TaxID=384 RepID=UPI00144271C0|nr:AAA family ATPase [Rhizobium leguminosarum]NKN00587.1 AAA family ATPase [Rhizobium leguminosarum bv. viciae]